jgi:N-acetylmuramoyl-L-alanine amidase
VCYSILGRLAQLQAGVTSLNRAMRQFINILDESLIGDLIPSKYLGHAVGAAAGLGMVIGAMPAPQTPQVPSDFSTYSVDGIKIKSKQEENVYLMALTMWGEARNGGPAAMRNIGHVIMNRLHSKRHFGADVKSVVWKRKAFSCWNKSDPNFTGMKKIASLPDTSLEKKRFRQAVDLARSILDRGERDPTNNALFYHTSNTSPYWADGVEPVAELDGHVFYDKDAKSST